jgi:O-antigen ligase
MSGIRYLPALLIVLAIAALPSEHGSHYPIGILFLLGLVQWVRAPQSMLGSDGARLLVMVFACLWIPMLLSLPDAANPARALKTTVLYLHFLPAGLYVVHMLADHRIRRIVLGGIVLVVGFWSVDGAIQWFTGRDLFGHPYDGAVLKGVFYPKQRFGLVLAVFTPLYLHAVQRLAGRTPFAWLLLAPLLLAVAFSLKRTAWVMLFAAVAFSAVAFLNVTARNLRVAGLALVVSLAALTAAVAFVPNLKTQISGTMKIFSTDFETADIATSRRLTLWKTGAGIARAHWLNGVGPRGYRTVYRDFAAADDFWILRGTKGQTHPHLMALEVATETGLIGLFGYALGLLLLAKAIWRLRKHDPGAAACLIVVAVAWLPLNAHLAFYGSYWSNIAWLMFALGCTGLNPPAARQAPA